MGFCVCLEIYYQPLSFPFLRKEFPHHHLFKTCCKDQAACIPCCLDCALPRQTWLVSIQVMKIQSGSSLSLLSRESCFLSNLFLLSLLVNEVMQLFIHKEPMGLLGFDGEMNYFGEALQYISASTLSLFIVRCCIPVHFLQLFFPISSIFLT